MKTLLLLIMCLSGGMVFGQQADAIIGTWLSEDGKGKVEVYKKNNLYYGKIVWLRDDLVPGKEAALLDVNNPDEDKQDRKLLGIDMLKHLEWDARDEEWDDGKIYDPESGNTYSVFARLISPNKLYLKGYIGISLFGRSTEWVRVN